MHPNINPERRAYQAGQNIVSLKRYRLHKERLLRHEMTLAQVVMERHADQPCTRITEAIRSGQKMLREGANFADAVAHSCGLLSGDSA